MIGERQGFSRRAPPTQRGATQTLQGGIVLIEERLEAELATHEHEVDTGSTQCRICGRDLTAPESVSRGIGPVCASGVATDNVIEEVAMMQRFEKMEYSVEEMNKDIALTDLYTKNLSEITSSDEARKYWILSAGLTVTLSKIYHSIKKDAKVAIEDKERAFIQAVSASEIKLRAEARLGELIREEQEAGKLAKQDTGNPNLKCNHVVTLADIGLTRMDSHRAQLVADNKDLIEEIKNDAIKREDIPTRRDLEKIVKKNKHDKRIQDQIEEIKRLPRITGQADVIVIDPPWQYEKRVEDVTHRGRSPYPSMSVEEIIAKPPLCADNCVVWLWTTNAFMHEAYHVLDAWSLEPKTILTWKKNRMGVGDWLRGITEHCIMAVKGNPVIKLTNQTTFLEGEAREHSRKPESFYQLVEALCLGSKYEMYQRERREGWEGSGIIEF